MYIDGIIISHECDESGRREISAKLKQYRSPQLWNGIIFVEKKSFLIEKVFATKVFRQLFRDEEYYYIGELSCIVQHDKNKRKNMCC